MHPATPPKHPAPAAGQRPGPADPPPLAVTSYGSSDTGRVRGSNEDCFVVADFARNLTVRQTNIPQPASRASSHRVHVFLVADGVGGNSAGEVASALSLVTVEEFLLNTFQRLTMLKPGEEQSLLNDLHAALFQADARLFREAARHPEWRGMGTTLTMALAVNRQLLVAHAGDSRCYLYSQCRLQQVTQDHTLTAEMERTGLMSRDELKSHPWRHVVSNLLGGTEPGVKVELHGLELHPDDVILLCTDGLTEMVPEGAIADILRKESDPRTACETLVAEANQAGGRDNVTVVVARFDTAPTG
ncbi:MAG TPA: protein phosphatase 2C domain-containing protein [Gemmataceae bacterium]|nr:protein phosphatase 2C domain-containing protein [Gemmataceae bacterium]